jgi:hypothetical protein
VISFCETITECVNVGLRMGKEFDFTSALLVYYCLHQEYFLGGVYSEKKIVADSIVRIFCLVDNYV